MIDRRNQMIWYSFPQAMGLRLVVGTEAAVGCVVVTVVPPSLQAFLSDQAREGLGQ